MNIVLSGLQVVDGITLAAGDRVLVKNQTDASLNGIFNASTGNWTRSIDAATNDQWANGTVVYVALGTTNADKSYVLTTLDPVTIGTSLITFLFLASSGVPANRAVNTTAPIAGGGTLAGDLTLSITINGSLQVTGGALAVAQLAGVSHKWVSSISATGVPQLTQPDLGDLTGTAIAAQGGTGRATLTAHAVLIGEGTGNVGLATIGTSGALLIDQGAGADPSFNAMSGDATITNAGALTIGANKVTNAKAAQMAASTLKGNNTGGLANSLDLTVPQAQALLAADFLIANAVVNFNSTNTDTAIAIVLPTGFTRYRLHQIYISGASASLTTATCGVFTATGGGGTAVVTGATAITVNTASENTNNNIQSLGINNQTTESFTVTPLQFRVQTPQGSAATGTVSIIYQPLS